MTALELLNETVEFYSTDVTRRAMNGTLCAYQARNGNKCAVGRCMTDDALEIYRNNSGESAESIKRLDDFLMPAYQGIDKAVWQELQRFHDQSIYWNSEELTEEGKERVKELTEKYTPATV